MVALYCSCGEEVGEICFAGSEHLGQWRVKRPVATGVALKKVKDWLSSDYDREMREVMEDTIELRKVVERISFGLDKV